MPASGRDSQGALEASRAVRARRAPSEQLLRGRITSFRREQGFGVITLDDGRDVQFDAANCTMLDPRQGDDVLLRIGPAKGGIKALHVEPPSTPEPPRPRLRAIDYKPWDSEDIRTLRSVAEYAEWLATADHDALLERHRRKWCKAIDDEIEASDGKRSSAWLTVLLDETPVPDAAVDDRLSVLANLEDLDEALRQLARNKLQKKGSA